MTGHVSVKLNRWINFAGSKEIQRLFQKAIHSLLEQPAKIHGIDYDSVGFTVRLGAL